MRNSQVDEETGISGDLKLRMVMKPAKTKEEVIELSRSLAIDSTVENTTITLTANNLIIYLMQTDARGTTKRRTLLLPLNLLIAISEHYVVV